jgi:hypothetical protein
LFCGRFEIHVLLGSRLEDGAPGEIRTPDPLVRRKVFNAVTDWSGSAYQLRKDAQSRPSRPQFHHFLPNMLRSLAMNENEEIFWAVHDQIQIERQGRKQSQIDLKELYRELKEEFFKDSVPDLSRDFLCTFSKLPFDVSGIGCLEWEKYPRTAALNKKGVRINRKLRNFPNETKVALLHEMVHLTGISGHGGDFKSKVKELWDKGAYLEPLII